MSQLHRVAFIGNYLPRRCGIATFTHDLHRAISATRPDVETGVVAMTDPGSTYAYRDSVQFQVPEEDIAAYVEAADFLNGAGFDVVSLQHEYGIFGGPAGSHILELLSGLRMPVVTTLHTVLAEPTPSQRTVMDQIIAASVTIVVMSEKGRKALREAHDVPDRKIEVIPHGIPDRPFLGTSAAKEKLGFAGKTIILTFGLLSPNKGVEVMLEAMPGIIKSCPNVVYVILGATHPNLVRQQGEAYRDSLTALAGKLGIEDHVVFFNQFVDQATLLDFISMCDVYVTPYLNEAQMTSGTLAYSFGLGKAVVSTPYWHAQELLGDGRGILVPFGNAAAIGAQVEGLLADDARRDSMRKRAYAESRSMTWPQTAKRYMTSFQNAREWAKPGMRFQASPPVVEDASAIAKMRTGHFLALCDNTGILQHAVHSVPDRAHGYCVDDNARALLLANSLAGFDDTRLSQVLTSRFAAFVQHAWNPDTRRFRNFMSYDRRWLEDTGSEDSHGRTLWALAECAGKDTDASRRTWAVDLFKTALPTVEAFTSPRAWAFTLLALDVYCALKGDDAVANRMCRQLADRLMAQFANVRTGEWAWFEDLLAYDNARLPQALIQTGLATRTPSYLDVGLQSLRWLISLQTAPSGCFRPIGTETFGRIREKPAAFDQQPVEAAATISACYAAWRADKAAEWLSAAERAFGWFFGENDLQTALVDPATGSCSDGLHPGRLNENKGAESVLAYLLSSVEMHQFHTAALRRKQPQPNLARVAVRVVAPQTLPGSPLVSIPLSEPSELVPAAGPDPSRREAVQASD